MNRIICFTPEEVFDMISGKVIYDEITQTGYMSKEKYDETIELSNYPVIVLFEKTDLFTLYNDNWVREKNRNLTYICCTDQGCEKFITNQIIPLIR